MSIFLSISYLFYFFHNWPTGKAGWYSIFRVWHLSYYFYVQLSFEQLLSLISQNSVAWNLTGTIPSVSLMDFFSHYFSNLALLFFIGKTYTLSLPAIFFPVICYMKCQLYLTVEPNFNNSNNNHIIIIFIR